MIRYRNSEWAREEVKIDIPDSEIRRMVESVTKAPEGKRVCPACQSAKFFSHCPDCGYGLESGRDEPPTVDDSLAKARQPFDPGREVGGTD